MQTTAVDELRTGGTVLPITRWGTPVMHARTRSITEFDDALLELVRNMFATMYAAEGVGLAATQVGLDRSVFVFDCPDDDQVRHVGVVCNPEVILPEGKDRKLETADEGCLSLPGAYLELPGPIVRFAGVTITSAGRWRSPAPACLPGVCSTRPTI